MTSSRLRHFPEEVGLLFHTMGGQRMLGRVLGWLMVCHPPEQTAAEIAEALDISAGSVSTTMRLMIQGGLVDKVGVPGDRSVRYRIRNGMWVDMMRGRMGLMDLFVDLMDRGLVALEGEPEERKARVREVRAFYAFLRAELPALLDTWEARQRAGEVT